MSTRNISWEIILTGLAFIAIAIYMLSDSDNGSRHHGHSEAPPPPPEISHLPSSIVIDLQNLENLENLKNLRNLGNLENLENLKNLEVELKNLDKLIEERITTAVTEESVEKSLRQVEQKLQEMGKTDFQVKLQDKKIFISRDYDVKEADWTEVSSGVFVFRESFSIPENGSLNLSMGFGNLNIVGKDASNSELTIRATGNVSSAKEIKENLRVLTKSDNESTTFEIGSGGTLNLSEKINLEATLTIPRNVVLNATTRGGHINANNLNGEHKLLTSGGHIMLDAISGITNAETRGGHITCDQLSGKASLKTSGGHIQITNADVDLTAITGGGHIEIDNFSGQADAKTSGGNISANIHSASGPLSFTTSAGNINITIPQSLGVDVNAKGNTVSLSDAFQFDGKESKGHISGTLNGGGIPLNLACNYGNVIISNE